jgi:hypothetical protein
MPGKHVRFADGIPLYSSDQSTPSSAYGSQYCNLPPVPAEINRVLAVLSPPVLQWDMLHPANTIQPLIPLSPAVLQEPATNPPLPYVTIICDRLPWTLTVIPKSQQPYVTVGDLLAGLYAGLRQGATAEEYSRIPSSTMKTRVNDAFIKRCKTTHPGQTHAAEYNKGLRRIDFLTLKTRFNGLSSTGHSFRLHVS